MNEVPPSYRIKPGESFPPAYQAPADGIVVRIWRRRGTFVLGLAIPTVIAVAVLMLAQPAFVATGTVMVGEQEPASSSASTAWVQKLGDPADMESQLLVLKSTRVLRLLLSRPGVVDAIRRECRAADAAPFSLGASTTCASAAPDSPDLLRHVEQRYSAQAVGRSRVISIGYESPIPHVAFLMTNALLITYLEDQRAQNAQLRNRATGWLLKDAERARAGGADAQEGQFYVDLHKEVSDLETERRTLLNGGRLVSLAEVPQRPYFPRRTPILAAGLTLGLILGSLAALLRDMTDRRVRRVRDLVAATGSPALGRIPMLPRAGNTLRQRADGMRSGIDEHSHALYARLAMRNGSARQCLLVTSSLPSEGKSHTAIGLARLAADTGRRVLLIDGNFRRPAIADAFSLTSSSGLADVLVGRAKPAGAIRPTGQPGLDVMAAGLSDGDPAMMLVDGQRKGRLDALGDYDLVIVDGPACNGSADALVLAHHADEVLWCVRWGHTQVGDVIAGLDALADLRTKVAGLAVTMIDQRQIRLFEQETTSAPSTKGKSGHARAKRSVRQSHEHGIGR